MAFLLVVDDETDVLDAMCGALSAAGHHVLRAAGGLRALDILDADAQAVDLLLTDVVMPGLHGFNLSRMARLRRPEIKVLYISGYADLAMTVNDTGPRFGKMLQKPILPEELCREVREALAAAPVAP